MREEQGSPTENLTLLEGRGGGEGAGGGARGRGSHRGRGLRGLTASAGAEANY